MDIFPIKTEADYRRALNEIEGLMSAEMDTPDGDRLDVLVTLVEAYEARHHAVSLPDPIEAIKFRMEQIGARPKDMKVIFGAQNRYHEVMKGSRPLSLKMIRDLHSKMGISASVLIQDVTKKKAAKPRTRVVVIKNVGKVAGAAEKKRQGSVVRSMKHA